MVLYGIRELAGSALVWYSSSLCLVYKLSDLEVKLPHKPMWYKKADSEWGCCSSHNRHNRCMVRTHNLRRRPSRRVPSSHQNRIVAEYGRRRWIKTSCLLNVTNASRHFSHRNTWQLQQMMLQSQAYAAYFLYLWRKQSHAKYLFLFLKELMAAK